MRCPRGKLEGWGLESGNESGSNRKEKEMFPRNEDSHLEKFRKRNRVNLSSFISTLFTRLCDQSYGSSENSTGQRKSYNRAIFY